MEKRWLHSYPPDVLETIDTQAYPSFVHMFEHAVGQFGGRRAFVQQQHSLSYGELDQLSRDLAAYLQDTAGIGKDAGVAIMLPNVLSFPIALFGAMRTGARITAINPMYTAGELQHQLNDAEVRVLIVWKECLPVLHEILGDTPVNRVITVCASGLPENIPEATDAASAMDTVQLETALQLGKQSSFEPVDIVADDLLFLQYTGGTTGRSKGAMLTHSQVVANVLQFLAAMGPKLETGNEVIVTALPLYHIFALTVNCLSFVTLGGTNLLIANPRDTTEFTGELSRCPCSVMTGVNTLYNQLLNDPKFTSLDFSALKICIGGGAAIQESVAGKWQELTGCPILQGYGLSETSPLLTINPHDTQRFTGSIGLPIPSTELVVRDDKGIDQPMGETGELCARGPQVMRGYWRQAQATAEAMYEDGFFKTGDIGKMDEHGFFYIVDRKKDVILVSGFNVFPNEIEAVVAKHNAVLENACIGVPDERSGEAVKVFVVTKASAAVTADELLAHCRQHLTGYKMPKHIEFIDSLPKSTVGKILRRKLRSTAS